MMTEVTAAASTSIGRLCATCTRVLQDGYLAEDGIDFKYHDSAEDWEFSIAHGCTLCKYIKEEMADGPLYPLSAKFVSCPSEEGRQHLWRGTKYLVTPGCYFKVNLWNPDEFKSHRDMRIDDYRQVSSSGSEPCIALIKRWISDCFHSHPQCERPRLPSLSDWIPTRLVYCASLGSLKLVERADITSPSPPRYMTLSHCWGNVESPICLRAALLTQWKKQLPNLEGMKTFHDAITLTRECGIDYIWIDSLCIIQDSEADWVQESALMENVYKYSYCNISAAVAEDDTKGCFATRMAHHPLFVSFEMQVPSPHSSMTERTPKGTEIWHFDAISEYTFNDLGVLNTRGWVVQERIMSPRVVSFYKRQLIWECDHVTASETTPAGGWDRHWNTPVRIKLYSSSGILCPWHLRSVIPEPLYRWIEIRRAYSSTRLTKRRDILVALSAIAREMQKQLGCRYLAGIFETNVLSQMFWRANPKELQPQRDGEAPSWSWASVPSWGEYYSGFSSTVDTLPLAEYKTGHVEPRDGDVFGRIAGGSMELDGILLNIKTHEDLVYTVHTSESYGLESSTVKIHWDTEMQATEGLLCMPLYRGRPKYGGSGLALELVRPGVYRRVGLVDELCVSLDGSSWLDDYIGLRQTISPDTGQECLSFDKSKWQRIVIV